jgi:hypothetical protein
LLQRERLALQGSSSLLHLQGTSLQDLLLVWVLVLVLVGHSHMLRVPAGLNFCMDRHLLL